MPLKAYIRPRLVILGPEASALDAARAIENNNIGAVVVQDRGEVVGIVTDRDLAVQVVGHGLDAGATRLSDIMTSPVAVLSPTDDHADAIALMQSRNVRRIPLVEAGRTVGIVTLDDLLLDEAAPLEQLAAVVESQIGEGGPAGAVRSPARVRSLARAEATLRRLLNRVRLEAKLENAEQAEDALDVVLTMLVRRLTPEEAKDLIAQLPSLLQPALRRHALGPDKSIGLAAMLDALAERLGVDSDRAAAVLNAVGAVIAQSVTEGQMEDVRKQLPRELRAAFAESVEGVDGAQRFGGQ
ncbi:MAG TPA: DUF2267 domain-containing protein [Gammaproteobacteria bacterium]|nr:DUF2267 domain-containing protein [Gammaproteobacteria bacterium]